MGNCSKKMGNCLKKNEKINPGQVLDRVISQANNDDDCLLYKLANYKKGGELIDAYHIGGSTEVEKLIREQFGILMYKDGKGQVISRTEYLRWKFRNTKHVVIPVMPTGPTDPLGKWEDHEACWQMQYRGSLGETLLHLLIICDTKIHTRLAKILLKCFPKLAVDCVEGEEYLGASSLHLAIAYDNTDLVNMLVESGALINQRATGSFFLPRDQQRIRPSGTTDYEGLAYLGEYPLAWAACMNAEGVYNLLIDNDADPDLQDSFGNMVLHMVVIHDQLGMFGYALRHPRTKARNDIINDQGLTPLTLACQLGRDSVFREMLELSCREFWRYSNITCSAYPLDALDTIFPDGRTNWNSALFMILAGSKEEHLNMLDGGIIQRLLDEKWKTYAQRQFTKRISIAILHLLFMSIALYLRPSDRTKSLGEINEVKDGVRMAAEGLTIVSCLSFIIFQQGEEIKNQGLATYLRQLPNAPPKLLFIVANFLILMCIPCRMNGNVLVEEGLLSFALVFSWFFMMFFAGAIQLTGPFVTMIYSMITGDMLTFSIIYGIFLLGFSQTFFYLYKSHPTRNETLLSEYDITWMGMYQMTLGSYSYDDLSKLAYPNAAKTVFILFMILVPILLLNMLIAMMGNTYSQVIERSEKEWVKQWAKIVVALERAVSQEDAKKYIQEYSIKLSGTDPSNEIRGVMVIKVKSKTKAKQRKGAVLNWKYVMKVTITALKRRKMTGEEMRQLMWGQRDSICTPKKKTRKGVTATATGVVDPNLQPVGATAVAPGSGGGMGIGGALDTLSFGADIGVPTPGTTATATVAGVPTITTTVTTVAPAGNSSVVTQSSGILLNPATLTNSSGAIASVQGSSPIAKSPPKLASLPPPKASSSQSKPQPSLDPSAPPPDYNSIVEKAGLPGYPTITDGTKPADTEIKVKRRNMKLGLKPRIIIFSDKKDLIRVSLDSEDESDSEICNLSFKKPSSRFLGIKSARRRSIAGESMTLSSSTESLAEETQAMKQDISSSRELLIGYEDIPDIDEAATNYAFDPDEFAAIESAEAEKESKKAPEKNNGNQKSSKPEIKKESSKSESQTDEEFSEKSKIGRPKSAKPKQSGGGKTSKHSSATSASPQKVKVTTRDSIPEQIDEEQEAERREKSTTPRAAFEKEDESRKEKSSKAGRSKSAKNGNKVEPRSKGESKSSGKSKSKSRKKEKADAKDDEDDEDSSSTPSKTRPKTALDRWNTNDVENMSKIVAWDRPEDDI